LPSAQKRKNLNENNFILGYIRINNPESVKFQKIQEGGFSKIYLAELSYWYTTSEDYRDQ
jgi:hypothetical protein